LRQFNFAFVDVCEILLRYYKPEPERLRPVDRMVAHTGFLIFARPVLIENEYDQIDDLEEGDEEDLNEE
ncbi:MAG: tRNA (adenine-N1)-methyltransferase, partial [Bellilinea sp.]